MSALLAAMLLAASACATSEESDATAACEEAVALADAAADELRALQTEIDGIRPPTTQRSNPEDGLWMSPEEEDALLAPRRARHRLEAEVRVQMERLAIVIGQHPECFTVEDRVTGERIERRLAETAGG